MAFETTKLVTYSKLITELQADLGTDMTEWSIFGEDVKQPDGSIVQHVVVTVLDPSIDTSGIQAVLDNHVSVSLADLRASAKDQIDQAAGVARLRYITSVPGQEGTYLLKAADCQKFKNDGYPEKNIASYPWVNAETVATGSSTGEEAADAVLAQQVAWVTVGSTIERIRVAGKLDIDSRLNKNTITNSLNSTLAAFKALP